MSVSPLASTNKQQWFSWRRLVLTGAAFALPVIILGVVIYREWELLLSVQWSIQPIAILGGFLLFLSAFLVAALTWADIMKSLGSDLPRGLHVRYYGISQLARRLPGTLWYIAGRGYLYKQHDESIRRVSAASGVELVIMIVSGLLLGLLLTVLPFTSPFINLLNNYRLSFQYIGLSFFLIGLIVLYPPVFDWMMKRIGLDIPQIPFGCFLRWLGGYMFTWLAGGIVFYLIAHSIFNLPWSEMLRLAAAWVIVGISSMLVFFFPTNLGFSEVGLTLILSTILPASVAAVSAIISRVVMMVFEIVTIFFVIGAILLKEELNQGKFIS
jgi:glycosyltransferase 2 family protein